MISFLRGKVTRVSPTEATIDVGGVGYRVLVPVDIWDSVEDGMEAQLTIHTYVREDKFDLFGFADAGSRSLFEAFIGMPGIGPKIALELCAVPRALLLSAIEKQDPKMLTNVKGVGKKTAEKLLLDLQSLLEKNSNAFGVPGTEALSSNAFDQDAVDALQNLGYDTATVLNALKNLPSDLTSTEERVAEALRTL